MFGLDEIAIIDDEHTTSGDASCVMRYMAQDDMIDFVDDVLSSNGAVGPYCDSCLETLWGNLKTFKINGNQ